MITPAFKIKLEYYLRNILNSYSSQCICLFGAIYCNIFGKHIHIYNVFYQPDALKAKQSIKYIVQLNKMLTKINVHMDNGSCKKNNLEHVKIVTCISRIISPTLDNYIISQYIKIISASYNFNQICNKITQKMIFRTVVRETSPTSSVSHQENNIKNVKQEEGYSLDYKTGVQVHGIIIRIHGRIPREPVRPRKTIQYKILGQGGAGPTSYNIFKPFIRPVTGINPELGTFSVWVQCIV